MADVTKQLVRRYSGLDADKTNADVNEGDHYFATDTKIDYIFDGTVWRGGYSYIGRSVNVSDFAVGNFVTDGTWKVNGLDLSGIVPAGAIAVDLDLETSDDAAGSLFNIRRNAGASFDHLVADIFVANITVRNRNFVGIDADRLLDYWGSNLAFITINVTVCGWLI